MTMPEESPPLQQTVAPGQEQVDHEEVTTARPEDAAAEETVADGPAEAASEEAAGKEAASEETTGEEAAGEEGEGEKEAALPLQRTAPPGARWYIVRAQSEREERIKEALDVRIRAAGMEHLFGRVLVPSEHISEIRGGKKRISLQKMYPRYILVEMELTDDSWLLINETPGISGFVSADRRRPQPMPQEEVSRILDIMEARKEKPKPKLEFEVGETVRIKEGPFQNYDGRVEEVQPAKGLVKVAVSIFGRTANVELEFAKVEKM